MTAFRITRRGFLTGLGLAAGGLALGVRLDDAAAADEGGDAALAPGPFVHVAADGTVTVVCHRSEMGQGIRSTMPALLAAELGADPARVRIVQAEGHPRYGDQNTDGSSSMRRGQYEAIRLAGATARVMLIQAAARRWRVPARRLTARDHAVHDPVKRRALAFADLVAAAARLPVPAADAVALRPDAELTGVAGPLVDGPGYVTGAAVFGADVRLPGMLTAVIARPPVVGGTVASLDDAAARAVPGVRHVITLPAPTAPVRFQPLGGVAVVADHTWAALQGRAALAIEWDHGANAGYDSAAYREALAAAVRAPGEVVRAVGDVDRAVEEAASVVEAEYHTPHLVHAPMEPPAAVARIVDGRCEVWACTQNPQSARAAVAAALGLDEADVTVNVTLLGGGFGRKSKPDYVVEAALLARDVGAPVRVQWTRDDEIRHAYYHSACAQYLRASVDRGGRVTSWLHRTAFPSISSTFVDGVTHASEGELGQGILDLPLDVPNVRCENGAATAHVRIGWLRSVHNIHHALAVGCFVDELAAHLGRDPRDLLLELYGAPRVLTAEAAGVQAIPNYREPLDKHPVDVGRLRAVVERVTERAGWADRIRDGRALGLAAHRSFVAYVAAVASVALRGGRLRVDEVWVSADVGRAVHPDRVRAQMEGAVIFGMSLALHGEITAKGGAIQQSNFHDYRLVRMPEAPARIHVDLVPSDAPPAGAGEPGVPPIAPAVLNAIHARTGVRIRDLPVATARLRELAASAAERADR